MKGWVMKAREIDQLVVAANSLSDGTDYLAETLGVRPQGGVEHTAMRTHNRLVRFGEDCYLEAIFINRSFSRRLAL
jgi:hypothetical protein